MQMPALTMPANFAAMDEEEMTYTTGGCFISGIIAGSIGSWLWSLGATTNLGIGRKEEFRICIIRDMRYWDHGIENNYLYTFDGKEFYRPELGNNSYIYYDGHNYWAGSRNSIFYKAGDVLNEYSHKYLYVLCRIFSL